MAKDAAACFGKDSGIVNMRKEYDFSKGMRGKHAGKRMRIVGENPCHDRPKISTGGSTSLQRDLKMAGASKRHLCEKKTVNLFELSG